MMAQTLSRLWNHCQDDKKESTLENTIGLIPDGSQSIEKTMTRLTTETTTKMERVNDPPQRRCKVKVANKLSIIIWNDTSRGAIR